MRDPLSVFYTQPFSVERKSGDGAAGPVLAPPVTLYGRIKFEHKLVRDAKGDEVVSTAAISMSIDEADIPAGSRVTVRGSRRTVIAEGRHIGGFEKSPDYYSIDLE